MNDTRVLSLSAQLSETPDRQLSTATSRHTTRCVTQEAIYTAEREGELSVRLFTSFNALYGLDGVRKMAVVSGWAKRLEVVEGRNDGRSGKAPLNQDPASPAQPNPSCRLRQNTH